MIGYIYSGNHRGIWRTMHYRLCIDCYGTGYSECVCVFGGGGGLNPPPYTHPLLAASVTNNARTTLHCSWDSPLVAIPTGSDEWLRRGLQHRLLLLVQVMCQVVVLGSGVAYSIVSSYWCNCLTHWSPIGAGDVPGSGAWLRRGLQHRLLLLVQLYHSLIPYWCRWCAR